MAIQNSKNIPNRMTKKKYFYDPSLAKAILNTVTRIDKDSTAKDYLNVCFCPDNNKLYVLWKNYCSSCDEGSQYTYGVDVICPNSTTKLSSPEATIVHNDLQSTTQRRGALLYCPNIRRVLLWTQGTTFTGVVVIDPQTNTIEQKVLSGKRPYGYSVTYNPHDNKLYSLGSSDASDWAGPMTMARAISTGKLLQNGTVSGLEEEEIAVGLQGDRTANWGEAFDITPNPNTNELHVAGDGGAAHVIITKNKSNTNKYQSGRTPHRGVNSNANEMWFRSSDWQFNVPNAIDEAGSQIESVLGFGVKWDKIIADNLITTSNVIYCPYDKEMYWLATRGWGRDPESFTGPGSSPMSKGIYTMVTKMSWTEAAPYGPFEPKRQVITAGSYRHLVYCPDNNMIYMLGESGYKMINPANVYGKTPVKDWQPSQSSYNSEDYNWPDSLSINWPANDSQVNFSEFCYSPVKNRIYGVGQGGLIIYIDVTK